MKIIKNKGIINFETKEIRCYLGKYKQGVNRCQLSGNGKSVDVFDIGWLDIEPKHNTKMWQELLPHPETPARPDIYIEFDKLTDCEIVSHGIYPEFKIIRCVEIKLNERKEEDKEKGLNFEEAVKKIEEIIDDEENEEDEDEEVLEERWLKN